MQGNRFTQELRRVSKCLQQAQGRVMEEQHRDLRRIGRWPSSDQLHIVLTHAAVMQWKMERVQHQAERHFIIMNAAAF